MKKIMTKKKDCLLSVANDDKSVGDITPPVIGSTSKDALLAKSGTSNNVAIVDETSPIDTASMNNNNDKGAKFESGFGFGFGGEQTPSDDQMRQTSTRCPWRGLTMAVVLLLFGSLLIMAGIALISGAFHLKGLDNVTPYLILVFGTLCFIPGAYHILVACCALRGHERFSFDDIPYFG